jgi:hypothetical protein
MCIAKRVCIFVHRMGTAKVELPADFVGFLGYFVEFLFS